MLVSAIGTARKHGEGCCFTFDLLLGESQSVQVSFTIISFPSGDIVYWRVSCLALAYKLLQIGHYSDATATGLHGLSTQPQPRRIKDTSSLQHVLFISDLCPSFVTHMGRGLIG